MAVAGFIIIIHHCCNNENIRSIPFFLVNYSNYASNIQQNSTNDRMVVCLPKKNCESMELAKMICRFVLSPMKLIRIIFKLNDTQSLGILDVRI